jgi:hypothetical protein
VVLVGGVIYFWRHPQKIYSTTMIDGVGGGGLGFGRRGMAQGMYEWKSWWDGSEVDEVVITYPTPEDARKDFEEQFQTAKTVYEQSGTGNNRRVVVKFIPYNRTVTVLILNGTQIRQADAESLDEARTFDRSLLKLW